MEIYSADREAGERLKERILAAFPAGHYGLDAFFRLTDIVLSDKVPSACVECVAAPQLLMNPAFLEKWCRTDEHLFMLVLHELHHVLLGHTRLFPRITPLDNIIFDAIINAILCQLFMEAQYWTFFTQIYEADAVPDALLRPPDGWPGEMQFPPTLPPPVQQAIRSLYSPAGGTYKELADLFEKDRQFIEIIEASGGGDGLVLLGDHSAEGTLHRGEQAANHPALNGAVRQIVEKWPQPPDPIRGRSIGHELQERFLKLREPEAAVTAVFQKLIRLALVRSSKGGLTKRQVRQRDRIIESPVPTIRDRRAITQRNLGGTPLIYRHLATERAIDRESGFAHVYVDVSGSTQGYWLELAGLVAPFVRKGLIRIFAFSERVADLTPRDLARGRIETTGGTDAVCIWKHALAARVPCIVILTDGYVGAPSRHWRGKIQKAKLKIYVGLTPHGYVADLESVATMLVQLPNL